MPCIIYRVSYENELKGKFCPLLGAFVSFSNASKKRKNEGRHGELLSVQQTEKHGKENGEPKGRIFDLLFIFIYIHGYVL